MATVYKGEVQVTLVSAKDLLALDLNGLSDPYCVLGFVHDKNEKLPKGSQKSKVVQKSLTPVWNESFVIALPGARPALLKLEFVPSHSSNTSFS